MAAFGVQGFALPDWMREKPEDESFGVLPENWDAVHVFMGSSTQWHYSSSGVPLGLRYEGVDVVLRRMKVADPDDAFARVRVMEQVATREFLAKAKRNS